jgi:hypothetical protein
MIEYRVIVRNLDIRGVPIMPEMEVLRLDGNKITGVARTKCEAREVLSFTRDMIAATNDAMSRNLRLARKDADEVAWAESHLFGVYIGQQPHDPVAGIVQPIRVEIAGILAA